MTIIVDYSQTKSIDNGDGTWTHPIKKRRTKIIELRDLGELLPDGVLLEIKDIVNDTNRVQAKRAAASRILTSIHSNVSVSEFKVASILSILITHTVLTPIQATDIQTKLLNEDT